MSSTDFAVACERARLSAQDGRVAFPRYRHEQLAQVYNALSSNREAIAEAIQRDSGRTTTEAAVELALALRQVKEQFDSTQFSILTLKEAMASKAGLITRGKGLVVLAADADSPLLSLITPLALAISAGNAVISILPEGYAQLNSLLKKQFATLDPLAFVFASPDSSSASELFATALSFSPKLVVASSISHDHSTQLSQQRVHLLSAPSSPFAAVIVDQSATDLPRIAKLIVRAKFFGLGRLAGSVNHVLVHSKVAGHLLELVLEEITRAYGANAAQSRDYGRINNVDEIERLTAVVKRECQSGKGKVVLGGASPSEGVFSPTVIEDASSNILSQPVRGPVLPFINVGSLEGALAVQARAPSNVLYIFAAPDRVRFLADESGAETNFNGDIPLEALIQPRSDVYEAACFSTTRRVISATSATSTLFAPFTTAKLAVVDKLFPRQKRLVTTRTMHSVPFLRAFFPQGLLLVGGSILLVILSSVGYGGFRGLWWAKTRYFS